ncbi:FitA-like ribbon-helix-helix domain-containing protein [Rhizobium sp. RAF56]|uniref:FitA-like ribbon-helix-helix domain-containing protein n=1 Tax=Rhizobium sp. RAF56 TaxID=3233062 RepID=UPI003F9D84A6
MHAKGDEPRDLPVILMFARGIAIIAANEINGDRLLASSLHVRNLDDDLITRLKVRAARHGRSAEAEHREILRQALENEAEPTFDELAAELRRITAERLQTPSEVLLREGRDER